MEVLIFLCKISEMQDMILTSLEFVKEWSLWREDPNLIWKEKELFEGMSKILEYWKILDLKVVEN